MNYKITLANRKTAVAEAEKFNQFLPLSNCSDDLNPGEINAEQK